MSTSKLLLKPSFWVAFAALIVMGLYLYGLTLTKDLSDLARAKSDLVKTGQDRAAAFRALTECNQTIAVSSERITELTMQVELLTGQNNALEQSRAKLKEELEFVPLVIAKSNEESQRQAAVSERLRRELAEKNNELKRAKGRIRELTAAVNARKRSEQTEASRQPERSRQPEASRQQEMWRQPETRRQPVRADRPETDHPFGRGRGKIVVYSICDQGGGTRVWIDNKYIGVTVYATDSGCNGLGGLSLVVDAGAHELRTRDRLGRSASFSVDVSEDKCVVTRLDCRY